MSSQELEDEFEDLGPISGRPRYEDDPGAPGPDAYTAEEKRARDRNGWWAAIVGGLLALAAVLAAIYKWLIP